MQKPTEFIQQHETKLLFVLLFIVGIIIFFTLEDGHVFGGDFAQYIEQSQAIISGDTKALYDLNFYTMENSDRNIGPYLYPVGFPLLLTPLTLLFGINFLAYKTYTLVFLLLAWWMTFILFKSRFKKPTWPLLITLMLLFNYYFIVFLDLIGSDVPYLFFALLGIWLIQQKRKSPKLLHQLALGAVITFGLLMRTSGLSLLFALLSIHLFEDFSLFAKKPFRYFKSHYYRFIPYLIVILGFLANKLLYVSGEANHLEILTHTSFKTAISNLIFYLSEISLFIILYYPAVSTFLLVLSLPFVILGIYKNRKQDLLYLIFISINLGIYAIWPERESVRFIFPVLPFYFYFFVKGILIANQKIRFFNLKLIPIFLLIMIAVQGIFYSIRDFAHDNSSNIESDASKEMFQFIKTETPENALFIFFAPRTLRFMTERNAIAQKTKTGMLSSEASYLLTFREVPMFGNEFEMVYMNSEFRVYKINRKEKVNASIPQ